MGIPIYAERGPYRGFSLVRGYKLPPLVFTTEEVVAIYLGTSLVSEMWGRLYQESAQGALAKLETVLPDEQRNEIAWARRTLVATGMHCADPSALAQTLSAEKRTQVLAWYQLAGSLATAFGNLAGADCHRSCKMEGRLRYPVTGSSSWSMPRWAWRLVCCSTSFRRRWKSLRMEMAMRKLICLGRANLAKQSSGWPRYFPWMQLQAVSWCKALWRIGFMSIMT